MPFSRVLAVYGIFYERERGTEILLDGVSFLCWVGNNKHVMENKECHMWLRTRKTVS